MHRNRIASGLLSVFIAGALLVGVASSQVRGAPANPDAPAPGWETTRINDVPLIYTVEPHAAAVDSQGRLHVAFGGDHLYYALCSPDTPADCTVETVDAQDFAGLTTALALDVSDRPHIAYFDASNGPYCDDEQIKYAYRSAGLWTVEAVAQSCLGEHLSLALDSSGTPAVAYFDDLWDTLQFAEREGPDLWNSFTLDSSLDTVGQVSALAYDSSGNLHTGYLGGEASYMGVWHRVRSGDTWSEAEAVDTSGYATRLDMAVDASGTPHFAYHNQDGSQLVYATLDGGAWTAETLFAMAYNRSPAITIHTSGQPHIAFPRDTDIGYIQKTAAGWGTPESIPTGGYNPLSLVRHPTTSQASLVYSDGGELQFTRRGSSLWAAPQVFAATGNTGLYVDLQIDPSGGLRAAYFDQAAQALRYGVYDGIGWQLETVLGNVDIDGLSLKLDAAGYAHIAFADYHGYQQSDLRYVYWDGLAWQERPPLSAAGSDPSLALASSGASHVAYTEIVNYQAQVTLAAWNGSSWETRTVADSGWQPRLLLDPNDAIYVSFLSGTYPDMRLNLAVETGPTTWDIRRIASDPSLSYHDLALSSAGWLHAVYQVDDPLREWIPVYAVQTASGWQREPVYSEYGEGEARRIDLALDASDRPHISSQYDHNLYYSTRSATGWETTFWLDNNEVYELDLDTGAYSGVVLDSEGKPAIAYYGEQDLKLARPAEPRWYYLPLALSQ